MPHLGAGLLSPITELVATKDGIGAAGPAPSDWFEVWSVLVAAVAALLALGSLLAQLREVYWSRPVIVLDSALSSSSNGWRGKIVVTNVGERAVTITQSGWWYSHGTHWEDVHPANDSTAFPLRLEPHDAVVIEGDIPVADAHWEWSNPGLFRRPRGRRADREYWKEVGAWRSDELPDHEQYAIPFVEIVRRPAPLLVRFVRRFMQPLVRQFDLQGWRALSRNAGPKGHARRWGKPAVIHAPFEGL